MRTYGLKGSGIRSSAVTARLVRHYRAASSEMVTAGHNWYPNAQDVALKIAESTGTRIDTAAAVIAALSPQTRWSTNMLAAQAICEGNTSRYPSMLGSNHARAMAVLSADNPCGAALGDGPKVHAFVENILGNDSVVTIDSWAVRAAVPNYVGSLDNLLKRKNVYSDLADCYRRAAAIVGERPCDLQAIVWCHVRGRAD